MSRDYVVLNLGAGATRMPGAWGVDVCIVPNNTVDVVADLDHIPYPFKENSVNEIHLYFTLEHLEDPFKILCELWRILKAKARIYIRVPHFSSAYCWGELTHKRAFSYGVFDIFQKGHPRDYYTSCHYNVIEKRVKYFLTYPNPPWYKMPEWQPHWEKYPVINWFIKLAVRIVQFFIDLSPEIFERFWCYWVGGAAEVYAVLEAQKDDDVKQ